jgi:hypothetical protein
MILTRPGSAPSASRSPSDLAFAKLLERARGQLLRVQHRRFDLVQDSRVEAVELGGRALERHASPKSREEIQPVLLPFLAGGRGGRLRDRERHEHLKASADRRARKPFGPDADDPERPAVHRERLAEHALVAPEARLPVVVAQDDHGRFADARLVGWPDEPPERFTGIAAHTDFMANLSFNDRPASARGALVSGSYFGVLSLKAVLETGTHGRRISSAP